MKKRELLYSVGIRDRETDEKISLKVWATNCDEATNKCIDIINYNACYRWTGTGPIYDEKGNLVTREVEEQKKPSPSRRQM